MVCESQQRKRLPSSLGRLTNEPRKIRAAEQRISFRDLAKLAARRKTQQFLSERTGCDASTAKRWLSGKSRAPDDAIYVVLIQIFTEMRRR
jgi:hypothetical protein